MDEFVGWTSISANSVSLRMYLCEARARQFQLRVRVKGHVNGRSPSLAKQHKGAVLEVVSLLMLGHSDPETAWSRQVSRQAGSRQVTMIRRWRQTTTREQREEQNHHKRFYRTRRDRQTHIQCDFPVLSGRFCSPTGAQAALRRPPGRVTMSIQRNTT